MPNLYQRLRIIADTVNQSSGLTLTGIKADSQIAAAISNTHASGSDNQDLSNLVVKETSKSLVSDTLITQIHASGSDNQDLSGLQPKETGKGLSANNLTAALKTNYDTSYTHSQTTHAPSNAQKNSDITKAEVEAALTGTITTHSHFTVLTVSGDKATGANTTPVTMGVSFDYAINSTYLIDFYLMVAPTAATTGCTILIDSSTAITYIGTVGFHQLANTGTMSGFSSVGDTGVTAKGVSSGMPNTGSNFVAGSAMLISNGSNAGTATFYFQSETTAVTTLKSGSIIRIMKV